jgi:SAM-dependent methyltransferase
MSKLHVLQNINSLLNRFGYNLNITKMNKIRPTDKLQINIGSGDWECDGWVNLDYPSEYYSKWQKKHKIIPYDICNDSIPFKDDSVDAIYCSHVVEHIENEHIQRMFRECYRVLKRGGVLRIATPDAEFIYNISKWENEYWTWRNDWFSDTNFYTGQEPTQLEYLVREIATPKLLGYKGSIYNTIQYNTGSL